LSVLRQDDLSQPRNVAPGFNALVIDIETGPNLGFVWGLWDQNVGLSQIESTGSVLCFAAKWLGDPVSKTIFRSTFHDGEAEMIEEAWDLIDQADAVIHYNGKAFDMKHLNREFLLAGLTPPSPHKDIDLLLAARSRFKFVSNKLDFVSQQLGVGSKVKHEGFELWKKCLEGDTAAWQRMKKYNIGDIKITEEVYWKLRPWIKNHPAVGMYTGEVHSCPNCGSDNLQRRGYYRTNASEFQRYRCNDCGGWSRRSTKEADMATTTRGVT